MGSCFPFGVAELQSRAKLVRDYPGSYAAVDDAALWLEASAGTKQCSWHRRGGLS